MFEDKDLELAEQEQELPPEIEEKKRKGALRTGYTTGTTATAATKAALYALIGNKLKNFLSKSGFEFTDDRQVADLLIDVRSDTERGSISGSIYITYLTGVIRVSSGKAGNEIYATTLDRIKGYGLDYDRSSVDAYNKTVETLEKDRMNELLDTVLQ